jgi:hypothetical protein
MDGALVGAGSHKPNRWIYGVIFLSLNGQQPQVADAGPCDVAQIVLHNSTVEDEPQPS